MLCIFIVLKETKKQIMKIKTTPVQNSKTTYLQGIASYVYGTPASELKEGSTIIWNDGFPSKVKAIIRETPSFIWIVEEYKDWNGTKGAYERKLKKNRIVARPLNEL